MDVGVMMIPLWLVACGCWYKAGYERGREAKKVEQVATINEFRRRIRWGPKEQ